MRSARERPWLALPEPLRLALQLRSDGRSDTLVRELRFERSIAKETRRLIRRQQQHSGAADAVWLGRELTISHAEIEKVLLSLGHESVLDNWYRHPANRTASSKNDVFHNNLRKMLGICGPLNVEDLHNGLRRTLSRTDFPVPAPRVLRRLLQISGYEAVEGRFHYKGTATAQPNASEQLILNCIRDRGPVVSFAELVEAFDRSKFTRAALTVRLQHSPLFDKADTGLYHLRGSRYTYADLQRARMSGRRSSFYSPCLW